MLKLNILGKTISYSSFKKRNRDKREQTLENELLSLYKKDMDLQETSKIEKVPRGIRGEKSSKDMASSRNRSQQLAH